MPCWACPPLGPRALIENHVKVPGGAAAYLVQDHVAGVSLAARDALNADLAAQLRTMLSGWQELRFSHGDMKASNFVLADGALAVLDLDAAVFHRSRLRFAHRHRRDHARLRRNWAEEGRI